jgi:hypothetical protein
LFCHLKETKWNLLMRIMVLRSFLGLSLVLCSSAFAEQPTLEQIDQWRARDLEAASRFFPGKSAREVRQAAYEVLRLVDPSDMRFDPRPDRLLASRSFAFTFLLSSAIGRDYYEVKYKEENGGTIVSLATELRSSMGLFPTAGTQPAFLSDLSIVGSEVPWRGPTIFFERLEYFLGLRSTWTTCAELKSRSKVKKEKYQPPAEFCGGMSGGLGIADKSPEEASRK